MSSSVTGSYSESFTHHTSDDPSLDIIVPEIYRALDIK